MKSKTDPLHEDWAARASQEHIVQARVRNAQAAADLAKGKGWEAVAKLVLAQDHLLQALTRPQDSVDVRKAYEAGFHDGAVNVCEK